MIFIDCNWTQSHDHLVHKRTLSHLAKLAYFKYDTISLNDWAALWVLFCAVHLTVCSYHVTYMFQSEYTLYSCLNVKELLVRRPVWIKGWVFVDELSGCGFESSSSHLNFKFRACFELGVPWHSGNFECGFTLKHVRDMIRTCSHFILIFRFLIWVKIGFKILFYLYYQ